MDRLHGTWLPSSAITSQRTLPQPLDADAQPLLQDKLARSRLQHFVSIIFDRPPTRDKSLFERIILAVLYPAAVLLLLVAVVEAYRWSWSRPTSTTPHLPPAASASNATATGHPLILEGLAVFFLSVGWLLWLTAKGQDKDHCESDTDS